ncbi:MAG TPA: copper-binding protein [Opitutaceae bacterium]
MKSFFLLLVALLAASPVTADQTAAQPEKNAPPGASPSGPTRHPLKGVVVEIVADRGSLLVKHEEVPGIMRAMTMLFKVTESDLKSVRKDQAITGLMVRKPDGWWLEAVKPVAP